MSKLKGAKEKYGFKRVWTVDGKILFRVDDSPSANPKAFMSKVFGYYVAFDDL